MPLYDFLKLFAIYKYYDSIKLLGIFNLYQGYTKFI